MGVRIVRCNTLPLLGVQMAKIAKAMGALEVKRLTEPGMHAVGTKRSDIGLGAYPAVPLADAWERARHALWQRFATAPIP